MMLRWREIIHNMKGNYSALLCPLLVVSVFLRQDTQSQDGGNWPVLVLSNDDEWDALIQEMKITIFLPSICEALLERCGRICPGEKSATSQGRFLSQHHWVDIIVITIIVIVVTIITIIIKKGEVQPLAFLLIILLWEKSDPMKRYQRKGLRNA